MNINQPISIYHAFDMRYIDILRILDELNEQGYSHIQLSPSQKSRTTIPTSAPKNTDPNSWWFRYQPLQFSVGNYYGTREDLQTLTREAHKRGLKVIADVCLNFMAELEGAGRKEWEEAERMDRVDKDPSKLESFRSQLDLVYPPFDRNDFVPRTVFNKNTKRVMQKWYMGQLPALDTESPKVQKVHFEYLSELKDCGVDGFRFDCAQWFRPDVMKTYIGQVFNEDDWSYLEVIERKNMQKIETYANIAPISDYSLGEFLQSIFKEKNYRWRNDIKLLESKIYDLNQHNVTFAVNHDTYHSKQSKLSLDFENNENRQTENLATGLLLGIKNGVPLIFKESAKSKVVSNGVKFRKEMRKLEAPETTFINLSAIYHGTFRFLGDIIVGQRGSHGFFILNRSFEPVDSKTVYLEKDKCLLDGVYCQVGNPDVVVSISPDVNYKLVSGIDSLPPRSILYFTWLKDNDKRDYKTVARKHYGDPSRPDRLRLRDRLAAQEKNFDLGSFDDFPSLGSSTGKKRR